MKKFIIPLLVLLVTGVLRVSAQVSINTDGSPPDNSAMLDVKSTSKGVLLPRVPLVSADLPTPVANPATGLIVYNTSVSGAGMNAVFPGYYFWNGQRWKSIEKTFDYYPYLTLPDGCPVTGTIMDIDGNFYPTVVIGTQEWMASNLKVTKYNDGAPIAYIPTVGNWIVTIPCFTYPDFNSANKDIYGILYSGFVIGESETTNRLCPTGWHIPHISEWNTLVTFLGGDNVAGGKMKTTGTTYWTAPNTGATNESCFSALPAGFVFGQYMNPGICQSVYFHDGAYFWIFDENTPLTHRYALGPYASGSGFHYISDLGFSYPLDIVGASVRCIKDQ